MTRAPLLLSLALLAAAPALATPPIYRCGADGRTYSQVPCPEGTLIEASDPRSAAQRAEAKRVAEAERRRAAELERERKAAEKEAEKNAAGAIAVGPAAGGKADPPEAQGAKKAGKDKPAEKDFTAVAPKTTTAAR